ncbi:MAG: hypothetical protein Q4G66_01315 [bacterium]|nr:hypothetical protein [bacterium]
MIDCVYICGVAMRLAGDSSPARAAVEEMLACLQACDPSSTSGLSSLSSLDTPVLTLSVHQLGPDAALDELVPGWLLAQIERLAASQEVALFYGSNGDCAALAGNNQALYCAWLSADARHISYLAQKRTQGLTPLSVSSVLVPILREFFAVQAKALVHAAGLQSPSGRGILLMAESGGGKTTSALSLVRAGARLLADDLVALIQKGDQVYMEGIPEALNLTPQTIAFFPELATTCSNLPEKSLLPNGKRILRADAVYEKAYQYKPCRLHALCLIEVGGTAPALQPIGVQQAFGHLLHAHTFARGQKPSPGAIAALSAALDSVPAFILQTGPHPAGLGPWLIQAVAEL